MRRPVGACARRGGGLGWLQPSARPARTPPSPEPISTAFPRLQHRRQGLGRAGLGGHHGVQQQRQANPGTARGAAGRRPIQVCARRSAPPGTRSRCLGAIAALYSAVQYNARAAAAPACLQSLRPFSPLSYPRAAPTCTSCTGAWAASPAPSVCACAPAGLTCAPSCERGRRAHVQLLSSACPDSVRVRRHRCPAAFGLNARCLSPSSHP